jgi:hypothetical protein
MEAQQERDAGTHCSKAHAAAAARMHLNSDLVSNESRDVVMSMMRGLSLLPKLVGMG